MILATSCGQRQSKTAAEGDANSTRDPFLLVPGERAGLFVLNREYEPVEKLYKDYGFRQEIDEWLNVNILRNSEEVLSFRRLDGSDIENTVGNSIIVSSSDFHTAEKTGVGASLGDLLNSYSKYKIKINFVPEEDYAPIKFTEYENIDRLLEAIRNGLKGIDSSSFICLDSNGERTGIVFYFELKSTDNPEKMKKESKVVSVVIREPKFFDEEGNMWF